MTVGNHEFDDGEDALVPFLDMIKFPVLSANVKANAAVEGRRPDQAVARARRRRPEDRHHRRGHQRHAGDRLARPEHRHRGRHRDDHRRGREAEGPGRQQDHRADPYRLSARQGDDRQDPGRRRGGRRPLALAAVEHRPQGRRPLSDDGRQSGGLQGAGDAGGVLFEVSRRVQGGLRRQRRRQGSHRATRSSSTSRSSRTRPCWPASRNSARRSRN